MHRGGWTSEFALISGRITDGKIIECKKIRSSTLQLMAKKNMKKYVETLKYELLFMHRVALQ